MLTLLTLLLARPLLPAAVQEPAAPEAAREALAEEVTLAFGWPVTGSVRVEERITAGSQEGATRYLLHWEPDQEVRGILLRHAEFELTRVRGLDASNPEAEKAVRTARWLNCALPGMRIDQEGALVGFTSAEEGRAALEEFMRNAGAARGEIAEALQVVTAEGYVEQVQASLAQTWQCWVGTLAGQTLKVGEEQVFRHEAPLPGTRATVAVVQRVKCQEVDAEGKGRRVFVRVVNTTPREEFRKLVEKGFAPAGTVPLEAEDVIEGVFEVSTLRPIRVLRRSTVSWEGPGGEAEQVEEHEYLFRWTDLER